MFCVPIYWREADVTNHEPNRLYNQREIFMNEFLLFAFIIVYLVIRHGKSVTGDSSDRQDRGNGQSSHPAEEQ